MAGPAPGGCFSPLVAVSSTRAWGQHWSSWLTAGCSVGGEGGCRRQKTVRDVPQGPALTSLQTGRAFVLSSLVVPQWLAPLIRELHVVVRGVSCPTPFAPRQPTCDILPCHPLLPGRRGPGSEHSRARGIRTCPTEVPRAEGRAGLAGPPWGVLGGGAVLLEKMLSLKHGTDKFIQRP